MDYETYTRVPEGPKTPTRYTYDYHDQGPMATSPSQAQKCLPSIRHLIEVVVKMGTTRSPSSIESSRKTALSLMQHRAYFVVPPSAESKDIIIGRQIVDNIRQVSTICPEIAYLESILLWNFDLARFMDPIQARLTASKAEMISVSVIPEAPQPAAWNDCHITAVIQYGADTNEAREHTIHLKTELAMQQQALLRAQQVAATAAVVPPRGRTGMSSRSRTATTDPTNPDTLPAGGGAEVVEAPPDISEVERIEAIISGLQVDIVQAEKNQRLIEYRIEEVAKSLYTERSAQYSALMLDRQAKMAGKSTLTHTITEMESILALGQMNLVVMQSITDSIKSQLAAKCPSLLTSLDQSVVIPLTGDEVHQPYTSEHLPGIYALLMDKFYRASAMDFFKELRTTVQIRMTTNNLQDGIALVDNVIANWLKLDYWKKLTPDAFSCMLLLNILPESLSAIRTAGMEHLLEHMEVTERASKSFDHTYGAEGMSSAVSSEGAAPKLSQYNALKEKLKLLVTSRTNPHTPPTVSASGVEEGKQAGGNHPYKGNNNNRRGGGNYQQAYAANGQAPPTTTNHLSDHKELKTGTPSVSCQVARHFGLYHHLGGGKRQPYVALMAPCRQCAKNDGTHVPACSLTMCDKCQLYGHALKFCAQNLTHYRAEIEKRKAAAVAAAAQNMSA